jgi:hypothetical protein
MYRRPRIFAKKEPQGSLRCSINSAPQDYERTSQQGMIISDATMLEFHANAYD